MKDGAVEFLTKPFRDQDLLDAVDLAIELNRRERQLSAQTSGLRKRYATLTQRERQVLGLVVRGLVNRQIGEKLSIRESTVKLHRRRLMNKMQADSFADLVKMAESLRTPSGLSRDRNE